MTVKFPEVVYVCVVTFVTFTGFEPCIHDKAGYQSGVQCANVPYGGPDLIG